MNLLIQCIKNQHHQLAKKMIRLALACQLDAQDENGFTALHWAVEFENRELVKDLLAKGASVHTLSNQGQTPLHLAAQHAAQPIAQLLVVHGACPHAYDKRYKTPWMIAFDMNQPRMGSWLKALPKVIAPSNQTKNSLDELIQFKMLEMKNSTPENQKIRQHFLAGSKQDNLAFVYPYHTKKRFHQS